MSDNCFQVDTCAEDFNVGEKGDRRPHQDQASTELEDDED